MSEQAFKAIILDQPLTRGETQIESIQLRKPSAGELRDISITALAQMNVSEICKVLPRISTPTLTDHEVNKMDIADLAQLGGQIVSFLLPKAVMEEYQTE